MEAVYTLLNIERGVPEVFGSCYDVRCMLKAAACLSDHAKLSDMKLPFMARIAVKKVLKKLLPTRAGQLLKDYGLV
jgi:oleate hydratase